MTDPTIPATCSSNSPGSLGKLVHDLRTPLSVISMGLEILKQVRHDEEQFGRVLAMISQEGVEPMKRLLTEVNERADTPSPTAPH